VNCNQELCIELWSVINFHCEIEPAKLLQYNRNKEQPQVVERWNISLQKNMPNHFKSVFLGQQLCALTFVVYVFHVDVVRWYLWTAATNLPVVRPSDDIWIWRSTEVVSRRLLAAESRVRTRVNPCVICGGQSGTGTGFSPSSSVLPCQYHSTVILHIHVIWGMNSVSVSSSSSET
jgi:hypothetical protein